MWNGYTSSWMRMRTIRKRAWKNVCGVISSAVIRIAIQWINKTIESKRIISAMSSWIASDAENRDNSSHMSECSMCYESEMSFAQAARAHIWRNTPNNWAILKWRNSRRRVLRSCSGRRQSAMNWEIFEITQYTFLCSSCSLFIWYSFIRVFRISPTRSIRLPEQSIEII